MKKQKGFTLIELIIIITCIGILAFVALPQFMNISESANEKSEAEIVGNVRTGLQLSFAQTMVNTGQGSYPQHLDTATVGKSSPTNIFFTNALHDAYRGDDWTKTDTDKYMGPAGNVYQYNASNGSFNVANP